MGSFYKGSTDNLIRRFDEHNAGKSISTARYIPWNLVWFTIKPTKAEAVQLEKKLKNLSIDRTIEFVNKYPVTQNLEGIVMGKIRVQP